MKTMRERIEAGVLRVPEAGCWLWEKAITNKGYGRVGVGGTKQGYAHRESFKAFNGEIPAGLYVLHRCDVRCCVNPAHLFLGTDADNVADMMGKQRRQYKVTRQQASSIKAALDGGSAHLGLAKQYGISRSQVSKIAVGKRWASA